MGQCLLHWHKYLHDKWEQTPRTTFTRTITKGKRAGVEETVCRRGQRQVVDGAKATGEVLLKQYRNRVERMITTPFLFNKIVTDTGIIMPSILVDGRQLMQKRSLTERTMRNHLAQLMNVGFITKKKWHGRKRSFELWVNPEYILKKQEKTVENGLRDDSRSPAIDEIQPAKGIKFPPIELPELQESQKFEIGQCGKVPFDLSSEKPFPEAEGCNIAGSGPQTTKQGARGRGTAKSALRLPADDNSLVLKEQNKCNSYVMSTWKYAKALLYPEYQFSANQEQLAKQAIFDGVYRKFEDRGFDFERYHEGVLRRVELAQKYFHKHAGRCYAPMPWAEIVKGRGYFDWQNEKGFRGTMAWLLADQLSKQVSKMKRAVRQALSELKLKWKLSRGEKTTRNLPKHIQSMSMSGLYFRHEAILKKYEAFLKQGGGSTSALTQFYRQADFYIRSTNCLG